MAKKYITYCFWLSILILASCSQNTNNLSELKWLKGSWESVEGKNYYEVWLFDNNQLKGISYSFKEHQPVPSEYLTITLSKQEKLTYIAQVINQNNGEPIVFTLQHETSNKWVFENKQHDFPQRITYFKQAGNFMRVIIDGTINNKFVKNEWLLKKTNGANLE